MNGQIQAQFDFGQQVKSVPAMVIEVITNPAGFFRQMPKAGGFLPPLVFMVLLGAVGGLLQAILAIAGLGGNGMLGGLAAVILMPVLVSIFSFVGAFILFIFWKILGSGESFETAFRCGAYTAAILPVTTLLAALPYVGSVAGLVWMTCLLVVASTEVHGIAGRKAWIAFGTVCAILALGSISTEMAARKISSSMKNWELNNKARIDRLDNLNEMTPEEAGRALSQFLKSVGQGARE